MADDLTYPGPDIFGENQRQERKAKMAREAEAIFAALKGVEGGAQYADLDMQAICPDLTREEWQLVHLPKFQGAGWRFDAIEREWPVVNFAPAYPAPPGPNAIRVGRVSLGRGSQRRF